MDVEDGVNIKVSVRLFLLADAQSGVNHKVPGNYLMKKPPPSVIYPVKFIAQHLHQYST